MNIEEIAADRYIHWGAHCSLYSGKTRSYLIKKGIDYVEVNPSHPHYTEKLLPLIGYFSVPVLQLPSGEIIQDSTSIIKYLEHHHQEPSMIPDGKPMQALAWLIHNYGTDGLFKPAMHYRWSYKSDNYDYIIDEFMRGLVPLDQRESPEGKEQAVQFGQAMDAYLGTLGVTKDTIRVVESSTETLLDLLQQHFLKYPYILGGRPSIADCGMMTALHAHLGRDPYPVRMMKERAPAVFRWTETMNRPTVQDAELWHIAPEFFTLETLPGTLIDVLKLLCADFGPELIATAQAYETWFEGQPNRPAGAIVGLDEERTIRQSLGQIEHVQQGVNVERMAWPDTLLLHQEVTAIVDVMNSEDRNEFETFMRGIGGGDVLSIRLSRPIKRDDFSTVLA